MAEDGVKTLPSRRIFVNNVDEYMGRNLSQFLSQCVVGASVDEIDEEEEDARSVDSDMPVISKEGCYEVIGTIKNPEAKRPEFVKEIIKYDTKDQLQEHLMECDIIVYDITTDPEQIDEAVWAVSELHSDLDKIEKPKIFILISTIMTWAKSKPLDPDDPELPFTEEDYRRRKPHPSFKDHLGAEKTVIKLGKTSKSKLVTYVVATGLTYGGGEHIFHPFFKSAWHNASHLNVYGGGTNIIPTIHVKDLGGVIQNIADQRPKTRYILAVDDSQSTLEDIVKAVSSSLGSGKVQHVEKGDAMLQKDIEQADFDMLLVNLRMDAVFVKENLHVRWAAETGLVENIQQVVKEYKQVRKLQPVRVIVLGPPASGKTTVVEQLCKHYKLHHVKISDVISEALERLETSATRANAEDQEEEDDGRAQEDAELLEQIKESKEQNNNRLEPQYVTQFMREKLKSMPCQNQGYILDGYPKTTEQAQALFADDEADDEDRGPKYDKSTMAEAVVCLEASDDFLRDRVMNLPESLVVGTHNTEEGLRRRLGDYRAVNTEDDTVTNYFDEMEIFPDKIDVSKDTSDMMEDTVKRIIKIIGEPRNYGMTPEEQEELRRKQEAERLARQLEEREERERREAEEAELRKQRQQEWSERLEEVRREEYELLDTQSIPLRNYLMQHVMPTLSQAMMDCSKTRPEDPIDYLAEYLFQANPEAD